MAKLGYCAACIALWAWSTVVTGQAIQDIRLVGGLTQGVRDGRVEIRINGVWGTVCQDDFDQKDAGVACRMLGFTGVALVATIDSGTIDPGAARLRIWLDNVNCNGNEQTLEDCDHNGFGVNDCTHQQDVGVVCIGTRVTTPSTTTSTTSTTSPPPTICDNPSPDVELVGGPSESAGRVRVRQGGVWGEICDDRWGREEAMVICRMLCYLPANALAHLGGTYGNRETAVYHLDDVQCVGDEQSIFDCPARVGSHNCDETEAAAVTCFPDQSTTPQLPDPVIDCVTPEDRIVAKFRRSDEPRLERSHLTLTDNTVPNCDYTTARDNTYVSISIPFIGCGTTREINHTHIIYSNSVHYDVPPASDVISRSQVYDIRVHCLMGRNGDPDEELNPEGATPPPKFGEGHPDLQIKLYLNDRFNHPIADLPARIQLGAFLYVGVVLTTTDPDLKVVVQECLTTAEEDRNSTPSYYLIDDKCATEESMVFYPINDTFFGFRFRTFKFLNADDFVYLHCKGIICDINEKTGRCDRSCGVTDDPLGNTRRRRDAHEVSFSSMLRKAQDFASSLTRTKRQLSIYNGMEVEGDEGPIYLIDPTSTDPTSNQPTPSSSSTTTASAQPPTAPSGDETENESNLDTPSSATSCQQLLSILVTMVMALLFS